MATPKSRKSKKKGAAAVPTTDSGSVRRVIGQRLRQLADEVGGPAALAQRLEVGVATVHRWLTGQTVPASDQLVGISEKIGASMEWLVTGRGPRRFRDLLFMEQDRLVALAPAAVSTTESAPATARLKPPIMPLLSDDSRRQNRLHNADGIRAYLLSLLAELGHYGSTPATELAQAATLRDLAEFLRTTAGQLDTAATQLPTNPE